MNNCPVSKVPIELDDMDDTEYCPKCGKKTLEKFVEKKKNPFLKILKNPLTATLIGAVTLVAGGVGAYSYIANSKKGNVQDDNSSKKINKQIPFYQNIESSPEPTIQTSKVEKPMQIHGLREVDLKPVNIVKDRQIEEERRQAKLKREREKKIRITNNIRRAWNRVKDSGSISKLRKFRRLYPNSKYDSQAVNKIETLKKISKNKRVEKAWKRVKDSGSISKLRKFRRLYPHSIYDREAVSRIETLKKISKNKRVEKAWKRVKDSGSISKLRRFRRLYPNSIYDREAVDKIEVLKKVLIERKMLESWKKVRYSKNISELRNFIKKYPNSKFVSSARKRINQLLEKNKTFSLTIHTPTPIYTPPPTKYYSLYINTIPSDAHISYSSGSSFSNGSMLEKGRYTFTVSHHGYFSKTIRINLTRDMSKKVYLKRRVVPPSPRPSTRKSKCTKQLDKVQSYINQGKRAEAILQLSEFELNARYCTQSERNRAKEFNF
jgi:outer membrane protein assembly factor BamD (BamD/ComL family)